MPLLITNLTRFQIDKKWLEKIGQKIWQVLGLDNHKEVGLILVTSRHIQKLNKKFRYQNQATDILSFNYQEVDISQSQNVFFSHVNDAWGDLVICLRQIKNQARAAKKPWQSELTEVLIHGILHLMNWNHTDSVSIKAMQDKTQEIYLAIQKSKIKVQNDNF